MIVAAGSSTRYGGAVPKQFCEVAGKPLLAWTISRFENAESIDFIELVVAEDQLLYVSEKIIDPYGFRKVTKIVPGGATRQESVLKGLERLPLSTRLVAIHDGARPMVATDDINAVVAAAEINHAAMLAHRVADTIKRSRDGFVLATMDRTDLFAAQTPQVFDHDLILEAHRRAAAENIVVTDDAALIEKQGFKIKLVEATSANPKVTDNEDMKMVEAILLQGKHG